VGECVSSDCGSTLVGDRVVGIGRDPASFGPSRGDIHFVDFPDVGGSVIRGPHPAAIVQADRMRRSSTVVVVPLTSSARAAEFQPRFLARVAAHESGLPRDGWAKCDQPITLPTMLLGPRAGRLNPEALARVDDGLRFALDL